MKLQLTHDDLDGVGSAIAFQSLVDEVVFIDYATKMDTITSFLNIYTPELAVISDINLDERDAEIIRRMKIPVIYIDHHEGSDVEESPDFTVVHDSTGKFCGTDLCYMIVEKEKDNWCKLAHDRDLWINKIPESAQLASLVKLLGPERIFDKSYFDPFALLEQDESKRALQVVEETIESSKSLAENTRVDTKVNNIPITVCATEGYESEVGNSISKKNNSIVIMVSTTSPNSISLNTTREDVDLSKLAQAIEPSGGGHLQAAGTQYPLKQVLPSILSYVTDKFQLFLT